MRSLPEKEDVFGLSKLRIDSLCSDALSSWRLLSFNSLTLQKLTSTSRRKKTVRSTKLGNWLYVGWPAAATMTVDIIRLLAEGLGMPVAGENKGYVKMF